MRMVFWMKKSHFECQGQWADVTGVYLVQVGEEAAGVFSLALLAAIAQNFPHSPHHHGEGVTACILPSLGYSPSLQGPVATHLSFCALTNVLASNNILPQLWTPRLPRTAVQLSFERLIFSSQRGRAFSGQFINHLGHKFKNQY